MLLNPQKSGLILVDVQTKLLPKIQNNKLLVQNCAWLLNVAKDLHISCIVSEQYPQGLGQTDPLLLDAVTQEALKVAKQDFSFYSEPSCIDAWDSLKKTQVVLIGIETQVCILQTAIAMLLAGYEVFVVADAVSSRTKMDHDFALSRMQAAGVQIVTKEMVFFEWCKTAKLESFKNLSKKYLQ